MTDWLAVLSMVLIIEGALPLLMPAQWKDWFGRLTRLSDGQLRFVGLICVACGVMGWASLR
ncbi:DUF2065 domain-containing protein [Roseateles sp. BYS87W]|uniref:DUF2065 domain-containing protein n=1 Tax=Pelomonas baiyunensis TaxID=3299026 RepID=A0ABW7GW74_9BURK